MIIDLLSNPRNVSTALMYAFAQRKDCNVLDEPFYAYYLKQSGEGHPMREEILADQPQTVEGVIHQIDVLSRERSHLFLKNMAHHLRHTDWSILKGFYNLIFIRHPAEVLASFAKIIEEPKLKDIAVRDQFELYSFFKKENIPFTIIDSKDLLKEPEGMLNNLCEELGIPFDPEMLSWPVGPKLFDGVWAPYWYRNVHKSSSFEKTGHYGQNSLPEHLNTIMHEALEYYKPLYDARLRL